jgi:hypothetical protein
LLGRVAYKQIREFQAFQRAAAIDGKSAEEIVGEFINFQHFERAKLV